MNRPPADATAWPDVSQETKPWTRWWWQGNSVDENTLTELMEIYEQAGLGGLEITPIYGVFGEEDQFIDFLSAEWVAMLSHTLREAGRLDIGIDMATGTGWPFGGPMVGDEEAPRYVSLRRWQLNTGEQLQEPVQQIQNPMVRAIGTQIYELHGFLGDEDEENMGTMESPATRPGASPPAIEDLQQPVSSNNNMQALALEQIRFERPLPLITLMAYSGDGQSVDLTDRIDSENRLDWTAPEGDWTLYGLFQGWHGKMVERAAPGGEGFVIDHFSTEAITSYLEEFDDAFEGTDISALRSFFNDSYEVDDASGEANWTPGLLDAFEQYRGYDLRDHIPALFGDADIDQTERVIADFRETISDLLLNTFTSEWRTWAHNQNALVRNQAHGSPANILDLYAASDIPETEGREIFRAKMASSAANVSGKPLIAAEASTWLDEHFLSDLSDVKADLDNYFLAGVNHVVYHGTAYSPVSEEWPGRLFYAAVHFNPQNPFWIHFSEFNNYVTRIQSFLQSGTPDNDLLLYYPVYDVWSNPGNSLLQHFSGGMDEHFEESLFRQAAGEMWYRGTGFDFVSDRQIAEITHSDNHIQSAQARYQTLLLAGGESIPLETVENILGLADQGATILVLNDFPEKIAGYADHVNRTARYQSLIEGLDFAPTNQAGVSEAFTGDGRVVLGESINDLLDYAEISRETLTEHGLEYVRRRHNDGKIYFLKNDSADPVNGWVPLATDATAAALFDPVSGRSGFGLIRPAGNSEGIEVYLQLEPGETLIVKTYNSFEAGSDYLYTEPSGEPSPLNAVWTITFRDGGPVLPPVVLADTLRSWTTFQLEAGTTPDTEAELYSNFSGLASYSYEFGAPPVDPDMWELNLGSVYNSASVRLNGVEIGTLFAPPYRLKFDASLLGETNELEIEVANLMANRIAWMDRENLPWKKFYNVNFPPRLGSNRNQLGLFDASGWEPLPSGLVGPVTLTPLSVR